MWERKTIVLMYHRINDALEPGEWVVPVARFREQMAYLATRRAQEQDKETLITLDDGYRDNYLNAYPVLKELGLKASVFLITDYIGTDRKRERYQDVPWQRDYLNLQEVREMAMNGITFGAHTATHPHLPGLGVEEIENEIVSSRDFLQKELGIGRPAFSYPYGEFDDRIKRIVKEAGFSCAFTVKPGVYRPGADMFEIPRIGIEGRDGLERFTEKLHAV